jgi:hypothetical protein
MSDIERIMQSLARIKNDGQRTHAALGRSIDDLSRQMTGVVGDFTTFGDDVKRAIQKWADEASEKVADRVLEIHGPRIDAVATKIGGMRACNW